MGGIPKLVVRLEEAWSQPNEGSRPWGIILASVAGAALAPLGLWGFSGASELSAPEPERVWASVEHLLTSLPATESGSASGILVGMLLVFAGAFLTGLVARRAGVSPRPAAAAALLFALSPLVAAALLDLAGRGFLLATVAWLAVLALEPTDPERGQGGLALCAQLACAAFSVWVSQAAAAPLLLTWPLLAAARRGRVSSRQRLIFSAACFVFFGGLLVLLGALPALGYGFGLHEGLSPIDSGAPEPAPLFASAMLAVLSIGADLPFLTPGRWLPAFAPLIGAGLLFLWLLVPTPAGKVRKLALRWGSVSVAFGAVAAVLVGATGDASAVPTAVLVPCAVGLAVVVAGLLEAPSRLMSLIGAVWRPLWGAVALFLVAVSSLVQSHRLMQGSVEEWWSRANAVDPSLPYAAVQLADLEQLRTNRPAPEPIQRMILCAYPPLLPEALERRLGLRVLRDLEHDRGVDAALAWIETWIARREGVRAVDDAVLAQRPRLQLLRGEVEAALSDLDAARQERPGPPFAATAARALLDALSARSEDAAMVERVVPVVEDLLLQAGEASGEEGVDAWLTLADLRMRQTRFIDASRAAEEAGRRAPQDPRPLLMLARMYIGLGQREDGFAKVQEAERIAPRHPGVRFMQGRILTTMGASARHGAETMLSAYEEAPEEAGELSELVVGLRSAAESLRTGGQAKAALALLDHVVQRLPLRKELAFERGRALRSLRRWNAAAASIEEHLAEHPGDVEATRELAELLRDEGFLHLLRGDRRIAVEHFQRVVAMRAEGVPLESMAAIIESWNEERGAGSSSAQGTGAKDEGQDVDRAREAFEDGLRAYHDGDLDLARSSFEGSIRFLAGNPLAWLNLGRIELEVGNLGRAEESLRAALSLGERLGVDVEHAYLLLARALYGRGERDEVAEVAAQYAVRHPVGAYREQIDALCAEDG